MKLNFKNVILLMAFSLVSFVCQADPSDPDAGPDPEPAPINKYIVLLILTGVYFAYQHISKKRKTSIN